jgi:hypothetical protein
VRIDDSSALLFSVWMLESILLRFAADTLGLLVCVRKDSL